MSRPIMLITGGAGGIGSVTAREFARQGHDVIIFDVPELEKSGTLNDLVKSISSETKARVYGLGVDVANLSSVKKGFQRIVEEFNITSLNVLIHNAARSIISLLEETNEVHAGEVLDVMLKGTVNVTVNALPFLRNGLPNASMIAVSSIASLITPPFLGIYAAGKAGLDKLMESWRLELEPQGIHVGILHVGATKTGMVRRAYMSPTIEKLFEIYENCQEGEKIDSSWCKAAKSFVEYVERPHQEPPEIVARILHQMVQNRTSRGFVTKSDERQFRMAKRFGFLSKRWFRNVTREVLNFRAMLQQKNDSGGQS